jgi:glucose/arabinose dehydrogenase
MRLNVFCLPALFCALAAQSQSTAAPVLVPHAIALRDGKAFSLNLPAEFRISLATQGLHRIRFMTQAPDGRIFATDMHDLSDNSLGVIYILGKFNAESGTFGPIKPYLTHLRNPNNVAFYTDTRGQTWLYVALTDRLERFKFRDGDQVPSSAPEVLAHYPDYGLNYKYGGWHLTRTVVFGQQQGQDKLYVAVGSSCNNCEEKEEVRATLSVMDPDGSNQRILARGLRNAVGLRYVEGTLYATNMGADHLGDAAPDDTMFALDRNQHPQTGEVNIGWPYCFFKDGKVYDDPMFVSSTKKADCSKVPAAYNTFAAHGSPLGLEYFDSTAQDPALRNSFLVALHGASKRSLGNGYRVVRVTANGAPQDFITGFLDGDIIHGRPCGILRVGPDAFLLTDDHIGVIYYIRRKN